MLISNNSKRILSQLFDIRPMKNSADLDWEAIKIVDKILDLKNAMTKQEVRIRRETLILRPKQNMRDLRENESVIFVKDNKNDYQKKPVKVRPFAETEIYPHLLSDDYFAAIKKPKSLNNNVVDDNFDDIFFVSKNSVNLREINEELPITQEDALREFEKVDARDNVIEERYDEVEGLPAGQTGLSTADLPEAALLSCEVESDCDDARGQSVVNKPIDLSVVETPEHSFKFIFLAPLLFSKIRFNGLTILVLAAFSFFSAAFFWDKNNNSGELISASVYQYQAPLPLPPFSPCAGARQIKTT